MRKWWIITGLMVLALACTNEIDFESLKPEVPVEPELVECTPSRVYFRKDIQPIIESHCAVPGCHDAGTPAGNLNLSSYDAMINAVFNGEKLIIPGDRDNSLLYKAVMPLNLLFMPPPRSHQLTDKMRSDIGKWIDQGAIDDNCRTSCDDREPKFQATIKPIIDKYCTGCHYEKYPFGGVKLFNYNEIVNVAKTGALVNSLRGENNVLRMPLGNIVPECEIKLIEQWIANGMQRD